MDSPTLVKSQIVQGARLITRLLDQGFPALAAVWALTNRFADWRLYLICEVPPSGDRRALNLQVDEALHTLGPVSDDPLEPVVDMTVTVLPPTDPLAQGVLQRYRLAPASTPARMDWAVLGPTTVDGAYIYPAGMFQKPAPAAG